MTVNHDVAGSSPAGGANEKPEAIASGFFVGSLCRSSINNIIINIHSPSRMSYARSVDDRAKQLSVVLRREIAKIRRFEAEQAQAHELTIFSGVSMTLTAILPISSCNPRNIDIYWSL